MIYNAIILIQYKLYQWLTWVFNIYIILKVLVVLLYDMWCEMNKTRFNKLITISRIYIICNR